MKLSNTNCPKCKGRATRLNVGTGDARAALCKTCGVVVVATVPKDARELVVAVKLPDEG